MSDPDANMSPKETPKRHWSRVVLVASLAANLIVVGLVAGAIVRGGDGDQRVRPMASRDFGFGPYIGAFDDKSRRDVGRAFMREAGGPKQLRSDLEAHFDAVIASLNASPFDVDAFSGLLDQRQDAMTASQRTGGRLVVEHVAAMSDAERAIYAERLQEVLRRRGPDDHKRDGKTQRDYKK